MCSSSFSSGDYFLKIEGVDGKSSVAGHEGEIELIAFSFSNAQTGGGASGGGSAGKAKFKDIDVRAVTSKASPTLMLACGTGRRFPKAVITGRKAGGVQATYLKITLTDVMVSSYQLATQHTGTPPVPVDDFSLNFAAIDFEYREQKADGSLGGAARVAFDLRKNVAK